jgi:hypothetical protein
MKTTDWIQAIASVLMVVTAGVAISRAEKTEKKLLAALNVLALTGCINASTGQVLTQTVTNIKGWLKSNPPDTWAV